MDITKAVEGLVYGIMKKEFPAGSLENCLTEAEEIEYQFVHAVQDLESLTFSGVKKGLAEAGQAIKMVPTLVKDCETAAQMDLSIMVKMAEVFKHPFTLAYHVGKNLIVNGQDIYLKIQTAITSYKEEKYFDFGFNLGEALAEIFYLNGIPLKRTTDEKAFNFLEGFFSVIEDLDCDWQTLYNSINGKGVMLYGPVESSLKTIQKHINETWIEDKRFWLAVHEVEHIFKEGGEMLVSFGVLTSASLEQVRNLASCLGDENLADQNKEAVEAGFLAALKAMEKNDAYSIGKAFAFAATALCGDTNTVNAFMA